MTWPNDTRPEPITYSCKACKDTQPARQHLEKTFMPAGWGIVTIALSPMKQAILCSKCINKVVNIIFG